MTVSHHPLAPVPLACQIDRPIGFTPKDNSYDPRHLLAGFVRTDPVDAAAAGAGAGSGAGADDSAARARSGTATSTADTWVPGFFDKGSFREYVKPPPPSACWLGSS